jgi:hypothetical protein
MSVATADGASVPCIAQHRICERDAADMEIVDRIKD